MAKACLYVRDELRDAALAELPDLNWSNIFQEALIAKLAERRRLRRQIEAGRRGGSVGGSGGSRRLNGVVAPTSKEFSKVVGRVAAMFEGGARPHQVQDTLAAEGYRVTLRKNGYRSCVVEVVERLPYRALNRAAAG